MHTLFTLAALFVILFLGLWCGGLVMVMIYFVCAGTWNMLRTLSQMFVKAPHLPELR